jgi:hypothetical protein
VGQVEDRFDSVGDSVNLGEIGAWFALNVPWACKSFWAYPMQLLGNVGQMEAHFGPSGGSVNLNTTYHRVRN